MTTRSAHGRVRFGALITSVALLIVAGCGKRTGEVYGTVTYQGESLPGGSVTFFGKDNQIIGSATIADGKYRIKQLPTGEAKITVTSAPPRSKSKADAIEAPGQPPPKTVEIPPKYGNPDSSGQTIKVKAGPQKHTINLD